MNKRKRVKVANKLIMNKNSRFNEDEMFSILEENDYTKLDIFIEKYGLNSVDRDGRNILMNCIIESNIELALNLILNHKDINLNHQDVNGYTALHFAVQEGHSVITETLIHQGAEINISDKNGNTPIWRGVFDQVDETVIIFLLENNAGLYKKNNYGVSPFDLIDDNQMKVREWIKNNQVNTIQ